MREARNFLVLRKKNLNLPQNEGEAVVFSQKQASLQKEEKKRIFWEKEGKRGPFAKKETFYYVKPQKKEAYQKKRGKRDPLRALWIHFFRYN